MTAPTDPQISTAQAALGIYEGHAVLGATVAIRNTGDGLSEAMAVDPIKLPLGTIVHVVVECEVEKHRYDPIKDSGGALQLVNMLKAGRATIIDNKAVARALDAQEKRIAEASGEPQLDLPDEEEGGEQ